MDAAGIVAFAVAGAVAGSFVPRAAAAVAEPRYGRGSDAYDAEDEALAPLDGFDGAGLRAATTVLLAGAGAGLAARYGPVELVLVGFALAVAVTVASVIDLRYLRLPDVLTYGSLGAGAAGVAAASLSVASEAAGRWIVAAAVGAALYAGFLFVVSVLFQAVRGRAGMGLGDVKLALPLGLTLGWFGYFTTGTQLGAVSYVIYAAVVGNVLGAIGGLAMTRLRPGRAFPFGPFLAAGWLAVLLLQPLR